MVFSQKNISTRLVIVGLVLSLGLLAVTTVQARQKLRGGVVKPPVPCKIPDGLYILSGALEGNSDINATLGMIQGRPVLYLMDQQQNRQTLVVRMPDRPHYVHKGGHPHDGHKRERHRGRHKSHDDAHHGDHRQSGKSPTMKRTCVDTTLTMRWHNLDSVPAGLDGELELTYRNNALTGHVRLSGNSVDVDDHSVTFLVQ